MIFCWELKSSPCGQVRRSGRQGSHQSCPKAVDPLECGCVSVHGCGAAREQGQMGMCEHLPARWPGRSDTWLFLTESQPSEWSGKCRKMSHDVAMTEVKPAESLGSVCRCRPPVLPRWDSSHASSAPQGPHTRKG